MNSPQGEGVSSTAQHKYTGSFSVVINKHILVIVQQINPRPKTKEMNRAGTWNMMK